MILRGKAAKAVGAAALVIAMIMGIMPGSVSLADSFEVKPYISFGADLNASEKGKVMELMEIDDEELADYETIQVTNDDEHEYLDEYLDDSLIGSRALSSVKIEQADAGAGIAVETYNITFCTREMYANALATAGITDADVTVAAPFEISGTAALVGAMKAYATMTGEEIDDDSADAATNELVTTGELGQSIGKEEAAEFVALLKDKVVSGDLTSEADIQKAIEEAEKELNVSISDSDRQKLMALMEKIGSLDLDLGSLKQQAKDIYDKLSDIDIDIDTEEAKGFFDRIGDAIGNFFGAIADFFKNLFN